MIEFLQFVLVGFAAQLIDGAIGMAYGLFSTAVLLGLGVSPAVASASVHAAEIATTGASGFAHWRYGNVEWRLVRNLAVPGAVGGILGATILSTVDAAVIRPVVGIYLVAMGLWVLAKAIRVRPAALSRPPRMVRTLGLVGGFLDAVGGGGWGPVVTGSMVGQGTRPKIAIGSTNCAEFFVTLAISFTFVATIGLDLWPIILGLVAGGVVAAPVAARLVGRLPDRLMMIVVGLAICAIAGGETLQRLGLW